MGPQFRCRSRSHARSVEFPQGPSSCACVGLLSSQNHLQTRLQGDWPRHWSRSAPPPSPRVGLLEFPLAPPEPNPHSTSLWEVVCWKVLHEWRPPQEYEHHPVGLPLLVHL